MVRKGRAGLYVHVPFCERVCPYCDFAVLSAGPQRRDAYCEALAREMRRHRAWSAPIDTVYLGGGTPSCLDDEQLAQIVSSARAQLPVVDNAWVSLEANPEHLDRHRARSWQRLGVGTVSLGVQSFQASLLCFLGRQHGADMARRAVDLLRSAGIPIVAIDLIYGMEGQSRAAWRADLDQAIALKVDHLSCYQLSIHPQTKFGKRATRGELHQPNEGRQAAFFTLTHQHLAAAGYEAYEVSNFARRPEFRSRHNQKYWQHLPYLGLGPSAHSFSGGCRWWNERKLRLWQRALAAGEDPRQGEEKLSRRELALEHVMLGLRCCDGIDVEELERRFDVDLGQRNGHRIARWVDSGLAIRDGSRLRLTLRGWAITDSMVASLEL